jgi:hypothetical protein
MTIRATAAGRQRIARNEIIQDILQDILIVSSFGLWAVLLGVVPIMALRALTGG